MNKQLQHLSVLSGDFVVPGPLPRVIAIVLCTVVFSLAPTVTITAQCDWTFYADSLTTIIKGSVKDGRVNATDTGHCDVAKESLDVNGTKYIYGLKNGVTSAHAIRITSDGLVYYLSNDYPYYRLCDTVGSFYKVSDPSRAGYYARYMEYLGFQLYYTLGETRMCKVFLEYYVWEADSVGELDTLEPVSYYILADSLGVVDEVDYHHSWQNNPVIGLWFGSRFVGDPLVSVRSEYRGRSAIAIQYHHQALSLTEVGEPYTGTEADLQLYDLYGRQLMSRWLQLIPGASIDVAPETIASASLCAWVLHHADGSTSTGIVLIE